jgi:2-amino-4-hydroxy-6-hydroxymethyldihydropteridine diphosphokinase
MAQCLIGLGSNLGDRAAQLDRATDLFCGYPQIHCAGRSTYHATRPIGGPPGQDPFLNAALRITTDLSPCQLLAAARDVEQRMGRHRQERWGPREIDIDILLYDHEILAGEELCVPHPRMAVRRFVLEPASEVGSDMIHPLTGWTVAELLQRLTAPPHYVAIAGVDMRQTMNLAVTAAQISGAYPLLDPVFSVTRPHVDASPHEIARGEERVIAGRRDQLLGLWATARSSPDAWYVSSYWLPQSSALARAWLHGDVRQQVEQACELAARQVPSPHCVVFLDASRGNRVSEAGVTAPPAASDPAESGEALFARELARQASLRGQVPVVHVPGGDLRLALTELTAAVDAMR